MLELLTQKFYELEIIQVKFHHQAMLVEQMKSQMEKWSACTHIVHNNIIVVHTTSLYSFLRIVTESYFNSLQLTMRAQILFRNAKLPSVTLLNANMSKLQVSTPTISYSSR